MERTLKKDVGCNPGREIWKYKPIGDRYVCGPMTGRSLKAGQAAYCLLMMMKNNGFKKLINYFYTTMLLPA